MDELGMAYAAALTLGAAHALEVDHMVAVSTFVGGAPRLGSAVSFGLRWGLGHSLVVLVAGGLLAWSGVTVPPAFLSMGELVVGVALVAVGAWAWRNARTLHVHRPAGHGDHAHLHSHGPAAEPHRHDHGEVRSGAPPATIPHSHLSTLMGAVHGLAGTAPVVALIPVTLMPSVAGAVGYLVAFGVGTTVAMGAYGAVAALAASRAASSLRAAQWVARGTAVASVLVGGWWLVGALAALRG